VGTLRPSGTVGGAPGAAATDAGAGAASGADAIL